MILEEATKEGFGYFASDLNPKSHTPVWVACELCGEFRIIFRRNYRIFCHSCSTILGGKLKGKKNPMFGMRHSKTTKAKMSIKLKGGKHPNYGKLGAEAFGHNGGRKPGRAKVKRICEECGKEFEVYPSVIKFGRGKYCSRSCGNRGSNNPQYKCGYKARRAKQRAKRRQLGHTLLLPLAEGEVGHHVTDEYVIGIPKEVHIKLSGGFGRKKHRALILQWLKTNDTKKYKIVLYALNKGVF